MIRIALSMLMLCAPLAAQDTPPDLAELWRIGSLWQVGDNREKVDAARKSIIEAGDAGLQFAMTRLGASDSLEVRCLTEVMRGFGDRAIEPLITQVNHADSVARRNVAELLSALDARQAAATLLVRVRTDESLPARLAQLGALSKWQVGEALPLVIEASRGDSQRARHRCIGFLAAYEQPAAGQSLIEHLQDETYYVRAAATEALKTGRVPARIACLELLEEQLAAGGEGRSVQLVRRLLPIVATLAHERTAALLQEALKHRLAGVRADAASALAAWKLDAGEMDEQDTVHVLRKALEAETDPFARAEIEKAGRRLSERSGTETK